MKPLRLGVTLAIGLGLIAVLVTERSVATQQVVPMPSAPSWIVPGSGVDGSGALRGTSTLTWPLGSTLAENASGKLTQTGTTPMLQLGGTSSSQPALKANGVNVECKLADDSAYTVCAGSLFSAQSTINTHPGTTGVTYNAGSGRVFTANYDKITIASTAFVCNAVTCDVTVVTLPAKTFVLHALADLTTTFACASTCTTSTLSATLGKTAGGNEYLISFDADAATNQFGDAAAELGASLAPTTTPTLMGDLASWSSTTAIVLRMTSGTGNIGNGAATNFSQGSVTVHLVTYKTQ